MQNQDLMDIARLCLALDCRAVTIYTKLAGGCEVEELRDFWQRMAQEEVGHCRFWEHVLELAEQRVLPPLFQEPARIKAELEALSAKLEPLWERYVADPGVNNAFVLALRIEFYLLHPAFETFFQSMSNLIEDNNPSDDYYRHLTQFIEVLNKHGRVTPELELLGETLQRLWQDNRRLARQSSVDELTNAFNRRGFFNAIVPLAHLARRENHVVGMMMADIDDFKQVNDTFGHKGGDTVLRAVADILRLNIRASDVLGRYGGEEFIIMFTAPEQESLFELGERIRCMVEKATAKAIPVTISLGIAAARLGQNAEEELINLMERADRCLYQAKRGGKNMVVVEGLEMEGRT
jgi:diguanylate cyclase (GGDEF)-like protein